MNTWIGAVVAVVATLIPAFLLISVNVEALLIDQKVTQSDSEVFSAPIVIVGVILSNTLVRGPVPSHWTQTPLQLRKLKIRVENVLRGNAIPETATVYYFTWAGAFSGPTPLGFWAFERNTTVSRRVFWLRYDSGVLRTACDGWDSCTTPANSGAHPNYTPDPRKPLGYALADIFLTRGEGAIDAEFARQVELGVRSTVPEAYLFEKLCHLAAVEVPIVRAAAYKALISYGHECVSR